MRLAAAFVLPVVELPVVVLPILLALELPVVVLPVVELPVVVLPEVVFPVVEFPVVVLPVVVFPVVVFAVFALLALTFTLVLVASPQAAPSDATANNADKAKVFFIEINFSCLLKDCVFIFTIGFYATVFQTDLV